MIGQAASSTVPMRPSGDLATRRSRRAGLAAISPSTISVAIVPGAIELQSTPAGPSSTASVRVRASRAALEAL